MNIDWDAQPLGRDYDARIARKLGVAPAAVAYQRMLRGIPAFARPGRPPGQADNGLSRLSLEVSDELMEALRALGADWEEEVVKLLEDIFIDR